MSQEPGTWRYPTDCPSKFAYALFRVIAATGLVVIIAAYLMTPGFLFAPQRRGPNQCNRHLKQIGIALHNYHDTYGSLPPASTRGPDGELWHSWRVLILPFLDEPSKKLFARYRFSEPWNGPSNRYLLNERPEVFECHAAKGKISTRHTSYLAVIGDETVWPGTRTINFRDVCDGLSNTILIVETQDAGIPWIAPDDLMIAEALMPPSSKPGRRPSSFHEGGGRVLMGDGASRFVSTSLDPAIWRSLLTRDGGEDLKDF